MPLTGRGGSQPLPRSEAVMEVLPLYLAEDGITLVLLGDLSIEVGWHASLHPSDAACEVVNEFGLAPIVAHSTSWRHRPGTLIVSYAVIVEPPATLAPMLRVRVVGRSALSRGSATRAPTVIAVDQVVEHALRHLSWLREEDDAVRTALPAGWADALAPYPPEPFRPFEGPWDE